MLRAVLLAAATTVLTAVLPAAAQQAPNPAPTAPAEVRGTWLTTTANNAIVNPDATATTMRRLREIGLNTVYLEAWKNGYTEYPSQTLKELIGVEMKVNGPFAVQRDLLNEGVIEAHRNGMLAIAWLEYGFMAAFKDTDNELRRLGEKEGWLLRDKTGSVVGKQNSFVWMNPLHPKAQEIVLNLSLDAVRNYDLDGIQLDDRIAMPTDMGYDDYTKALYAKEHGGQMPPEDRKDPRFAAWTQWRADKISEFAKRYASEIRKARPGIIISVSPAPFPWSLEHYACDWPKWLKWERTVEGGGWDEFIPQTYRMNFERTKASIEEQVSYIGDRKRDLIPGIRVVGDGPDLTAADLTASIQLCRDLGLGGHVLWFSRGVLDVYPETLKNFYNVAQLGHAPHPARPADWRPLPTVAKRSAPDTWTAEVKEAGKYRVIARRAGQWKEEASREFPAGAAQLKIERAEAVELLRDRR